MHCDTAAAMMAVGMESLFSIFGTWWSVALPLLLFAIEILGIVTAFHAIRQVRTSQAAVAWGVGLVALPILIVPMYWLVGRNRFSGYRDAIRDVERQHQTSVAAVCHELITGSNVGNPSAVSPVAVLADVLDTPLSDGNQVRLLVDGAQFLAELLRLISTAEKYVYAEFYVIRDDDMGNQFANALCARARAGCTVRLLYDEVGSLKLSARYLLRLRAAGVDVHAFNTRQGWANRFQLNFRNHRKLLVVDGRRAIVGGLNIGDEYLGRLSWATRWRDTAIAADGPVARKVQAVFASDYYWARRDDLPEADWSVNTPASETAASGAEPEDCSAEAAVCATGPSDQRERATMMFAAVAGASRQRLWISTPYLVPNATCINALSMARARGVDVRILIPSKPDQWLVFLAGFYYEALLESIGISVYRYTDGFLHQKCVLADDQLVLIGSTNLDNRSLHLNFELMLAVCERELIRDVTLMLEQDFSQATKGNVDDDRLLPWYIRIGTVIARLFSPVL
ncbi:MAG: cardiolipin synthase [Planctomycetaceae bacterium]